MGDEYGIVANVTETDSFLRTGSKAWLVGGTGGEGWFRFEWIGRTRSGGLAQKWVTTKRFSNFRCAWIPDHIRKMAGGSLYISGTKEKMEAIAERLNKFRQDQFGQLTPELSGLPTQNWKLGA